MIGPENRLPHQNGLAGGIALDATMLKDRVIEIAQARLKDPMPVMPSIRESITISHKGSLTNLNVSVVRGAIEDKYFAIVQKLHSIGVDASKGTFSLGEWRCGPNQQGVPTVEITLDWLPAAEEEKPSLSIVK